MSGIRPHLCLKEWLEKLDLSMYKGLFQDYNGVEDILWMSERDLRDIGIKNGGHRARLSSSLNVLKEKYKKLSIEESETSPHRSRLKLENGNRSFSSLSPVNQIRAEKSNSGARSWPSSVPSSLPHSKSSSPRLSLDGCSTEATADELKQSLEKELSLDSSDLRSHAWYHGTILRQRAENLVSQDGDFLVRDCISQPGDFVITCKWNDVPLHFIIKKIVLNPHTVYERIQFCFEKDSFDSIPDFITHYVGSKQPLSESSGAIISKPINRSMPLTYYMSRFGVQCQIQYAARKLENLPANNGIRPLPILDTQSNVISEITESQAFDEESKPNCLLHLNRVSSDPMISPNTEQKKLQPRPHSGTFSSEIKTFLGNEDKAPPKPSRVPSRKCDQKPVVIKRFRADSIDEHFETVPENAIKIRNISPAHQTFKRKSSETRFSFLDRPSVSDDGSDTYDPVLFTIPSVNSSSSFDPQNFNSGLLSEQNLPLDVSVLSKVKQVILTVPSKLLACHLAYVDLEVAKNLKERDLGLGVTSGLELLLLPQGQQLQKDLLERTECMKLFVAITLLTTSTEMERAELLNKWIDIAMETKTGIGNLFGFTSIMLGLTIPEILGLQSTWLSLRHSHTDSAFAFETKLRPTFKTLQQAASLEAPNTCLPYLLSLLLILQKHKTFMDFIEDNLFDEDKISRNIDFEFPGSITASDFGLQLLESHLELGRYIMHHSSVFQQNSNINLPQMKFENILLDLFSTEFHLRILWGFRGSIVNSEERHKKFQKVLSLLYNKCEGN